METGQEWCSFGLSEMRAEGLAAALTERRAEGLIAVHLGKTVAIKYFTFG